MTKERKGKALKEVAFSNDTVLAKVSFLLFFGCELQLPCRSVSHNALCLLACLLACKLLSKLSDHTRAKKKEKQQQVQNECNHGK